jgi:hypothetical protein
MLINQYRILTLLDPENKEEYETNIKALEDGYQFAYEELVDYLSETFADEECRFVIDTLNMFEMIARAVDEKKIIIPENLKWKSHFIGFGDNQGESVYNGYSRFLIHKEGKFPRFRNTELHSPVPTKDRYKRMLEIWEQLPTGEQCSPSEATIQKLLEP